MGVNQSRCDDVASGVNDLGIDSRQRSRHRGDFTVFDEYVALRDCAQRRVHCDKMAPAYDDAAFRHAVPSIQKRDRGHVQFSTTHAGRSSFKKVVIARSAPATGCVAGKASPTHQRVKLVTHHWIPDWTGWAAWVG